MEEDNIEWPSLNFGLFQAASKGEIMTDGLATRVVLAARPKGKPIDTDFRIEKFPIPQPGAKELLLQTRYLSLDP
jgi:NADPH-dependent curcumin reductase CurA